MCLAVPAKVIAIEGKKCTAEVGGAEVTARLDFLDEVAVGDYVLIHAGFAISTMDEEEALEVLSAWQEISQF